MSTPPTGPTDPAPPPAPGPWQEAGPWMSGAPEGGRLGLAPPASIVQAVKLMYVGAALSLVGIVITILQRDEIREQLADADSDLTADELDAAVNVAIGVNVVIALIVVGLWLWMARMNGRGVSWARTVATVLGVLNVVFTALSFASGQLPPLGVVSGVVSIVLAVVILVLLYRDESNRYYDAMSR